MKEFSPDAIRNITLIGHGGSGKTTLSELMLYTAGETNRIGSVLEGNTVSDYTANEIERQFSISLSLLHIEHDNTKINIIDTPGYSDFVGDVKAGMKVCDTAVMLLKAVEGIEVGSENAGHYVDEFNLASAIVINKCDNEHSRFDEVVELTKERLTNGAIIVTFPANQGLGFNTVVDVLKMKAYTYGEPGTRSVTEIEIPADLVSKAEALRTELIEKVAELDENLMNTYFENGTLTEDELSNGITASMIKRSFTPVFAVSADKAVGVNNFLDFVVKYFPSPLNCSSIGAMNKDTNAEVNLRCDTSGDPVMFIFKTISEQHVGELSLFRVYSGKVGAGLDLLNVNNGKSERLSQISVLNGRTRKEITNLFAGDIGAVVKLKDTHTNNTLSPKLKPLLIKPIEFPDPIIRGAIVPKAKGDEDKISACLHTLHEEDPSFNVKFDPELSQTIISGQGELHLALAVKRLKERYKVEVDLVEPRIPYRETIKGRVEDVEYKHKKQSGGRGQFGHVHFKMEPQSRGVGFEFVDAIVGGVVPGRFIPAVEKGIIDTMGRGVLSGNQVVDVKVTLHFGSYHDVDSDEMSFKLAASQCFKKGFLEAKPCLLEPIYEVEVKVPDECMGDVMGDISSRRGKILGMDSDGHFQIIKANVPLSELYKYSSTLRSLTAGRGAHKRKFAYYEEVPKEIENKIVEEYKKARAEGA